MKNDDNEYLEGQDHDSHLPASVGESRTKTPRSEPRAPEPVTVRITSVEELPATFDDVDGEWRTILTKDDPFAVLFLDARNWRSITVAMVKSRHEILAAFWKKKIMALRSGAQAQILQKDGGPDRSEHLVESFPLILDAAYDELSTEEGIRTAGARLERLRTDSALAEIEHRLEIFLVDGELTPLESRSLFAEATRLELSDELAAQFIAAKLTERGASPIARPRGGSLKEQLCSATWSVSRHRTNGWKLLAVAAAALVIIVVALLFAIAFRKEASAPRSNPVLADTRAPLIAEKVVPQPAASQPRVSIQADAAPPPPAPVIVKSKAETEAEREAVAAELHQKSERAARDAAQTAHEEIERSLTALRNLAAQDRFEDVETESERLLTLAARHSLSDDITTIREIASAARERKTTVIVDQERRERYAAMARQIEQLTEAGKYPEAISLANDALRDPQLPADLRERILDSQKKARTELKRIMSSAVVKGGEVKPVQKH